MDMIHIENERPYHFPKDYWKAATYDSLRYQLIPSLELLYRTAADAVSHSVGDKPHILDIGAGTGLLTQFVLAKVPDAQYTLIDASPDMLAEASARFSEVESDIQYKVLDFGGSLPKGPFDVVVSALAIHHLTDSGKRNLFERIYSILKPGGLFVNVEQLAGPSEKLEKFYDLQHEQHVIDSNTSAEEWAAGRERMRHDIPADLFSQLEWLRLAGFKDVDCLAKDCRFATYVGSK